MLGLDQGNDNNRDVLEQKVRTLPAEKLKHGRSYRELGETIPDHPAANCSLTGDGRIGAKKRHFEDAVPKNRCSSGKNGTLALSQSVPCFLKEKSGITSPNFPHERTWLSFVSRSNGT
jgi:hypothetical protein